MAKIKVPELSSSTFKGWAFVLVAGCELLVMALTIALATGLAQTPPPS